MTVVERIRAACKARGLTQKILGEACGIAEPTIRWYEFGKLISKYRTLAKITATQNTSVSELMGIGAMTPGLLEKKYREREQLAEEARLDAPSGLRASLSKTACRVAGLIFLEILKRFRQYRNASRSWAPVKCAPPGPRGDSAALINSQTEQVYIISCARYIDALETVLHNSKKELSRLPKVSEKALSYEKVRGWRGIYAFSKNRKT